MRLALNPLLSTVGDTMPWLISGTVIVSVVLGLPTVGPPFLTALVNLDMFFAGFIILFLGLLTTVGTLLSDVQMAIADPRCQGRCKNVPAGRSKTVPLNAVEWASRFVGRWRSGSVR